MNKPSSFFKFVAPDRIDVLKSGTIRFTPPTKFNDPFELKPYVSHLTQAVIDGTSAACDISGDLNDADYEFSLLRYQKLDEYVANVTSYASRHGVLSLSACYETNPNPSVFNGHAADPRNNLLMWAHYCASHTGFVIEFGQNFVAGAPAEEVCYDMRRPILTFEEIDSGRFPIYLTKSREWQYENEWRMFRPLNQADEVREDISLFKFDKSCVRSITIGANVGSETLKEIEQILCHKEYQNVRLFRAQLNEKEFALEFEQTISNGEKRWTNSAEFSSKNIQIQKTPR